MVRKATAQEMEILLTSPSAAQPHCSTRAAALGWKTYSRPRCRMGCRCRRLVRPTCATSCSERRDLTTGGYRPGAGALPARPGGPAPPPLPSTRGGPAELRALLARREKHIHHGQRNQSRSAESMVYSTVGSVKAKPSLVSRFGTTYMSPVICSASSPRAARIATVGTRRNRGRCDAAARASVNSALVVGCGRVRLYGPAACSLVPAHRTTAR